MTDPEHAPQTITPVPPADMIGQAGTPSDRLDEQSIKLLVHSFYGRIRQHPRLGEIFNRRLEGRWEPHLEKMEAFWQSVLLKNGAYKGKPVPAHMKLKEVASDDYVAWLGVFRSVASECFTSDLAATVIETAERIAQSLWLACFGFPGAVPPAELKSH